MSKVIRDCFDFSLPRYAIGSKNSRHLLNQSDSILKPITTWLHAFLLQVLVGSSLFSLVMFGCCDYLGFGYTILKRKEIQDPVVK